MRLPRLVLLSVLLPVLTGLTFGLAGVSPATAAYPTRPGTNPHGQSFLQLAGTVLPGFEKGHSSRAGVRALENAQHVFDHKAPPVAQAQTAQQLSGADDDATMALTSLFQHRDDLNASDKKVAARVLARPAAALRVCDSSAKICVHYSTTGANRATTAWAKQVLSVVSHVSKVYASSGYRRPVGDGTTGGYTNYTDIYLADVAPQGYYGYCAPESGKYVATAYCVLDNDYAPSQYGTRNTPLQNLEVTAAHEFFHAVQFAYDVNEDVWFMEASATWAEDQIYTSINDNRQYLPYGQLRRPRTPLDKDTTFGVYGNWIFFRYLSEHLPKKKGALPSIMLQIWQRAAVSANRKHNAYSVEAITSALAARGRSLKNLYAGFAVANLHPKISYREGRSTHYPMAEVAGVRTLTPAKKQASGHYTVAHLSSATQRFTPHNVSKKWHLRIDAQVAKKKFQVAIVTVYRKHKTVTRRLRLDGRGRGHLRVDFANSSVVKVELTFVNTAHGYKCHQGSAYACKGRPTVDGLKDTWSARLVKS